MKRKILSFLLILTLIISVMPMTGINFSEIISTKAKAAENDGIFTWGDYEYTIININEIEITSYAGSKSEVIIPAEIDGMSVTSIGKYSFNGKEIYNPKPVAHPNASNNKNIQKVVVPSSVKTICANAFGYIDALTNVVLNEGLEVINEFAFTNCQSLTELDLPDSLVTFEFNAVAGTPVTELVFGSNVKSIDITSSGYSYGNSHYSYVKKVIFNADSITIENISLPSITSMPIEIVCNGVLTDLFKIKYKGSVNRVVCNNSVAYNTVLKFLSNNMFCNFNNPDGSIVFSNEETSPYYEYESNGFRYSVKENSEAIISRYTGDESIVTVPETLDGYPVTEIGRFAFSSFSSSNSAYVNSPDKLIPEDLITSITLPETIEVIGDYAFAGNLKLTEINIPSKVTTIPYECFNNCNSLECIDIPQSVNKIEANAFYRCEKLKSISLPISITEIRESTFSHCSALEFVDMPGVNKIEKYAFHSCEKLVITDLPECLTELGDGAFYHCESIERLDLSNVTKIGAEAMCGCIGLKEVVLNNNLENLERGVFDCCSSLERIELPEKLVSIGSCCFRLSGLKDVTFKEGLKTIGACAFDGCFYLTDVVLPDSLEYIWDSAFAECKIEEINIPVNLKILGYRSFALCDNLTTVYFNAVNCKVSNLSGDNAYVPEDWSTSSPFYKAKITNIYFGNNITAISNESEICGTFENCDTLQTITIPDSVNEIGTAAFKNCTNLETALIPDSVTEIADDAFEGCDSLTICCVDTSYAYSYAMAKGIAVSTFIIEKIPNQTYTGSQIKPAISVSISNKRLTENTDFTVSYSNNINVGEAKVKVKGLGDYSMFTSSASFTIVTKKISAVSVAPIDDQPYTGSAVTPDITVTDGIKVLRKGADYTVTYVNNINEGTATAKITGIGNYSGTVLADFQISKDAEEPGFFEKIISSISSLFAKIISFLVSIFM